ncbi:hypothetical protein BZA70DRAFT_200999 [Myxozyma melibiosi]|uniref:Uncharacterized protein n=1 Tax=Myxozyma melibiosi TaxID=54550 RepID=A0ABR1F2N0_9ASCO
MLAAVSSALFACAHVIDITSPFVIYSHIRTVRPFRRPHTAELRGISVDMLVLNCESAVYRLLWALVYLFPSETVRKQHRARYPVTNPTIDSREIIWQDVPLALSALVFTILMLGFDRRAAVEQIRLRCSPIAKYTSLFFFLCAFVVFVLASYVHVDQTTGMAFYGLYYIDFVDLLKGLAHFFYQVRLWPQLVINWEENCTVTWSTTFTHLLLFSSGLNISGILLRWISLSGLDRAANPAPGRLLSSLHTLLICTLLYGQIYWLYKRDNERAWRGIMKRASDDGYTSDDSDASSVSSESARTRARRRTSPGVQRAVDDEEGRIGLVSLSVK